MDSIFTKIIRREIPAEIIYEDDYSIVIPDKFPSMPGQLLVIAKRQVAYLFDLSESEYQGLMTTTKHVAKALDKVSGLERTCIVVEGFEVPHVHVKLFPANEPGVILHPIIEASSADLEILAQKVTTALGSD